MQGSESKGHGQVALAYSGRTKEEEDSLLVEEGESFPLGKISRFEVEDPLVMRSGHRGQDSEGWRKERVLLLYQETRDEVVTDSYILCRDSMGIQ